MNILTFDIEEWFHILDNSSTKTEKEWSNYESRIDYNMDKILDLVQKSNTKATFFIVGWIAEKYPEVVRRIDNLGYEIGTHTHMHQLVYEQSPKEFKTDLSRSINTLENITGKKIRSFRAPGFSITENNKWAFDILHESGITHDCSVFPAGRSHGGFPSYNYNEPAMLQHNGISLKEFPISTTNLLGKKWIYSGGGYFRLTPYSLIKHWTKKSSYIMTYFHPRDFDPEQPMIENLSYARRFKSYVGLGSCHSKLESWLRDFEFMDLQTADSSIDWTTAPVIDL